MNSTPTATVPNKYRNDLTAGACYGQLDFTEQPLAAQYVACLGCPVRDLCPVPTPWPKRECCRRGHLWGEKYANGACKACQRTTRDDSRQRAEQAAIPTGIEDLAEYQESRTPRAQAGLAAARKVREVAP